MPCWMGLIFVRALCRSEWLALAGAKGVSGSRVAPLKRARQRGACTKVALKDGCLAGLCPVKFNKYMGMRLLA